MVDVDVSLIIDGDATDINYLFLFKTKHKTADNTRWPTDSAVVLVIYADKVTQPLDIMGFNFKSIWNLYGVSMMALRVKEVLDVAYYLSLTNA